MQSSGNKKQLTWLMKSKQYVPKLEHPECRPRQPRLALKIYSEINILITKKHC